MKRCGRGLVDNEEQGKNKKMKSIVVEEQDQKEGSEAETGKSEEQDENKKMKSIVVEEQEQKEGSEAETGKSEEEDENKKMKSIVVEEQELEQEEGSESGFVLDLYPDVLYNVLKHMDIITLGRAACVDRLWNKVAWDARLWEPFIIRNLMNSGKLEKINKYKDFWKRRRVRREHRREFFSQVAEPPPVDFYLIDPQVFSRQIGPWR